MENRDTLANMPLHVKPKTSGAWFCFKATIYGRLSAEKNKATMKRREDASKKCRLPELRI